MPRMLLWFRLWHVGGYYRRIRQASLVGVCVHEDMIAARGLTVGVFFSCEPIQMNLQLQLLTTFVAHFVCNNHFSKGRVAPGSGGR